MNMKEISRQAKWLKTKKGKAYQKTDKYKAYQKAYQKAYYLKVTKQKRKLNKTI